MDGDGALGHVMTCVNDRILVSVEQYSRRGVMILDLELIL